MLIDVRNLRRDLPVWDTPELAEKWAEILAVLTRVGELEVPCAMGLATRRVLCQTILAMGATDVLDIGTYVGTSATTLALTGANVVTVDIRDANAPDGYWKMAGRGRTPRQLTIDAGVQDRVTFTRMDSRTYLHRPGQQFDLISIDGLHEHFVVEDEIALALRRLKPNGLIFLDDVQPADYVPPPGMDLIDGPRRALERYSNAPVTIHQIGCTAFLTRRAS